MNESIFEQTEKLRKQLLKEDKEAMSNRYPKKTFKEQIEILKNKGVNFNKFDETSAIQILQTRNYYYKLTVYKRNFRKNEEGKYIDLDFKDLVDIASLDMQLRYILLKMTLDIEHTLKTYILNDITNNENEDGFSVVRRFFHSTSQSYKPLNEDIIFKKIKNKSHYQHLLYKTHQKNVSAWVLLEVISFGDFLRFFEFYYGKNITKEFNINSMAGVFKGAKRIRNACAHSNPFLFGLNTSNINNPSYYIKQLAGKLDIQKRHYSANKIHDFLCLFIIYDKFMPPHGAKTYRM